MSTKADSTVKKHHWLIAAQLIFLRLDDQKQPIGEPGVMQLNAMVLTDQKEIDFGALSRAQVQCIQNGHKRFEGQNIQIVDCVFLNISHLGYMSEKAFSATTHGLVASTMPVADAPANQEG